MESAFFLKIVEMAQNSGALGVVLLIWYFDKRQTDKILRQYQKDMTEQRQMYESNVELVKQYQSLAADSRDVITLNIQAMTRLVDRMEGRSDK